MTDFVLYFGWQFCKSLAVAIRQENRVVTKAVVPTVFLDNLTIHFAFKNVFLSTEQQGYCSSEPCLAMLMTFHIGEKFRNVVVEGWMFASITS